jgi:hypothetical protein
MVERLQRLVLSAWVATWVVAAATVGGTCAADHAAPPDPPAADLVVAPDGDDASEGTADRPVATLRRALDLARDLRAAQPGRTTPLVIEATDGRHELADTLVIEPKDSGTEASPTVIRAAAGARPVFSGGRVITGWRVEPSEGGPRWRVELPAVGEGSWQFCQLFVDDQRRFRPTVPTSGWQRIVAGLPPSPAAAGQGHDRFVAVADGLREDWMNLSDVDVLVVHRWSMSRLPIATVRPLRPDDLGPAEPAPSEAEQPLAVVTFGGHTGYDTFWASMPAGHRFRAENVGEALGEPGSWYLDRPTGTLTYCPEPGERPETAVVIAPLLDRLVELRGTAEHPLEHVRFEGLTFAHGNWTRPATGQACPQADVTVGGTIVACHARHVALVDSCVRHVGRYAVEFSTGCRDCTLQRCELVDLGGGGVLVGTGGGPTTWGVPSRPPADAAVTAIAIRDCTIRAGGRLHPAAVGAWIGHADHIELERCDISDLTYTGVSVGWSWGYGDSAAHHNRVAGNHIHDIGQGVLSDLGGVYTLGVSPGTVVEGNRIHDVASADYGGWGLYTDEGSTGIVLRGNVVFRTTTGGFHQHYGRDNLVENNVFASARDWQLERSKVEDHVSFVFERNVIWWNDGTPLVKGDWSRQLVTRRNCYWNAAGEVRFPDGKDLAARQAAGQDAESVVADPRLADPLAGDFRMADDSPARALGFVPPDTAAAGRRTPVRLTAGLPPVPSPWPECRAKAVAPAPTTSPASPDRPARPTDPERETPPPGGR